MRASRPQRIATSGWSRRARARIACSVTASQPLPRWEPGLPGADREDAVEEEDALLRPGREVAVLRLGVAEILAVLLEDVAEAAGERPYVGGDAEAEADGWPGVG